MYNKRNVMKNAWEIRKESNVSMSVALKAAWALEKALVVAEKTGKESGWNYNAIANRWAKYGKDRTYVSTKIYTNAWNCKKEIKLGYVDNMTGDFIAA